MQQFFKLIIVLCLICSWNPEKRVPFSDVRLPPPPSVEEPKDLKAGDEVEVHVRLIKHLKKLGNFCTTQNTNVHRFTFNLHCLKIMIVGKLPLKYYVLRCWSFLKNEYNSFTKIIFCLGEVKISLACTENFTSLLKKLLCDFRCRLIKVFEHNSKVFQHVKGHAGLHYQYIELITLKFQSKNLLKRQVTFSCSFLIIKNK